MDEGVQEETASKDVTDEVMEVDGMGVSAGTSLEAKGERDDDWFQTTADKARREDEKLEAEMRNYSINLIKESIRVSNRWFLLWKRSLLKVVYFTPCSKRYWRWPDIRGNVATTKRL